MGRHPSQLYVNIFFTDTGTDAINTLVSASDAFVRCLPRGIPMTSAAILYNHHSMTDQSSDRSAVGVDPVAPPVDPLTSQFLLHSPSEMAQLADPRNQPETQGMIYKEHPKLAKSKSASESLDSSTSVNAHAWRQNTYTSYKGSDPGRSGGVEDQGKRKTSSRIRQALPQCLDPSESHTVIPGDSQNTMHQDIRSCKRPAQLGVPSRWQVQGSISRRGLCPSTIDFQGNPYKHVDWFVLAQDEGENIYPGVVSSSQSTASSDSMHHGYSSEAEPDTRYESGFSGLISESGLHWINPVYGLPGIDGLEANSGLLPQFIQEQFRSHSPHQTYSTQSSYSRSRKSRPLSGSSQASGASLVRKRKRCDRSLDVVAPLAPMTETSGTLSASRRRPEDLERADSNSLVVQSRLRAQVPISGPSAVTRSESLNVGGGRVENQTDISRCVGLKTQRASSFNSHLNAPTPTLAQSLIGSPQVILISEIIPRTFSAAMRFELLHIFRTKAKFIPRFIKRKEPGVEDARLLIDDTIKSLLDAPLVQEDDLDCPLIGLNGKGWPKDALATEIFQNIGSYLSHKDLQCLRLVNREFEYNISGLYFKNVVIEFSSEIWGRSSNHIELYRLIQNAGKVVAQSHSRSINIRSILDSQFKGKGKGKGKGRADPLMQLKRITNFMD